MHLYTLIDPITGQQTTLSEVELTQNLAPNYILLQGREHIGIITHRDLVAFARWCAMEAIARAKGTSTPEAQYALTLVDRWLEDEKRVTPEELEAVAEVAWAAVDAADAARAIWAAADAAWAAARAARAIWVAADVARSAEDRGLSYKSQAQWLVEHLQSGK